MKIVSKPILGPDWPKGAIYIGRGRFQCNMLNTRPGVYGWLGNPVIVGQECPVCGERHMDGGSTLKCYEDLLVAHIGHDVEFAKAFMALDKDATLVCWCAPNPCHGEVIKKIHTLYHKFNEDQKREGN